MLSSFFFLSFLFPIKYIQIVQFSSKYYLDCIPYFLIGSSFHFVEKLPLHYDSFLIDELFKSMIFSFQTGVGWQGWLGTCTCLNVE